MNDKNRAISQHYPSNDKWAEFSQMWADVSYEIVTLKNLIGLCERGSENANERLESNPTYWPMIFEVLNMLIDKIEKKLYEMDSLIAFCRQYQERKK